MNWNRRILSWAGLALAAGIALALPAAESDAQKRGLGGSIFGRPQKYVPTVYRLEPLPVSAPVAKPEIFRGFYIGMPVDEAIAAAAKAVAPWPAYIKQPRESYDDVAISLRDGPEGARTVNSCIRGKNPPYYRSFSEQFCIIAGEGDHFRFQVDSKTNLVEGFTMSASYVLYEYGYNVRAAGLDPEGFANLLGKRLGISFKKITREKKKCNVDAVDAFWGKRCIEDTGSTAWWVADDPKICKCRLWVADTYQITAEQTTFENEDALRF